MAITLRTATVDALDEVVEAMASWQHDGAPVPLHPGDLGWNWSFGSEHLAAATRVWHLHGRLVAVGLVDDGLVRLGISPAVDRDAGFAAWLLTDLEDMDGITSVEARSGKEVRGLLGRRGWTADEPWTPLIRDLTDEVEESGLRIEVVDGGRAADRVAVQRAAFAGSTFTLERWHAMAGSSPYRRARCLLAYDAHDAAVAVATVWSAGEGRPGLIEPLGVHRDHRGHGHGRAITLAAAAALRELGSSSATVCTPSSNVGGVATYAAAGFDRLPDVTDFRRPS